MTPLPVAPAGDRDYVLGTHDDEIARLGVQHRVWRPRVLDAWRRAGFSSGQTLLDVGCGPGFATVDLAAIVGPLGRVVAMDRSRRFLDALETTRHARELDQITAIEMDLDEAPLPAAAAAADGAWCRWVTAFVKQPRELVARIGGALRPGGEPNVGLDLPGWLEDLGFRVTARAVADAITPSDNLWMWPRAFVDVGLRRLVDLERLSRDRAAAIWQDFLQREAAPHARMLTPVVLEIIARKITPSTSGV